MYTEILDTHYGKMLVPSTDINQVRYYKNNNHHIDKSQIDLLVNLLKSVTEPVIVDCGANVGFFTFGINQGLPGCTIHTFEVQRVIYNMVCGSVALNSFENIFVYHNAVSSSDGETFSIPKYDYNIVSNFGSVEVERKTGHESIGQAIVGYEQVAGKTVDSLNLSKLNLLKIDVEGMEERVLEGATQTILRCRPLLFIEYIKSDRNKLVDKIKSLGYNINDMKDNYLCVPE